ncbi:hypothetical protein MYSTI_00614 [Myxococcus stipitatus DSM 14675]|uniref:Uncharacterized protein n=1 Tax=Myxococcus stipitatus (strain DSM 14675 / JCM 12634 / Mx s8) TaxID=1278073 RepID=L7U695_MYXSD|nr:hypothetical protein [Myxococcus stipitatus]AGC41964.1 hypothetical protein MYSTI_00614 [Myxococcus stipitatus DSM 14675]
MSKIVVVPRKGSDIARLARAVRQVLPMSLAEIQGRDESSPLAEFTLFGNDHEEAVRCLNQLLGALAQQGIQSQMYELRPGEKLEDVTNRDELEVSEEQVESILLSHERELARQHAWGGRGERS